MSTSVPSWTDEQALSSFRAHLSTSKHVMAVCGAGLSAPSGLPTFRGAGGLWRNYESMSLATPEAFKSDPGLVWLFYAWRRHMALRVNPNRAHYALAELAKRMDDFVTLTQNVDGLSPRAGHPASKLLLLHGSIFDVKCSNRRCSYIEKENLTDPLCPALASASSPSFSEAEKSASGTALNARIDPKDLPHCPQCNSLLRPGVVWFGETLPEEVLDAADEWCSTRPQIDLLLVIGTSAVISPAVGYIDDARSLGARVAVVNMDEREASMNTGNMTEEGDWYFCGDAAEILPEILKDVIGNVEDLMPK